ncbi:transmembrane protease serine 11C-like [Malaclemys terrapin pileata]|uniref:transmembrane protease serine 11C-like n=1 Tax=Malaclemys terrapin pileata TaxID=2991368 RepID=UPI0023A8592C|nr:transmembrane protease serine 11C-like [Malaclemys terrapin pileata]
MKTLRLPSYSPCNTQPCDDCMYQQHSRCFRDFGRSQRGYQTYRGVPWDLQRVHQLGTKPRFFKPWKIALIVVAVAMAAAITIGILVYFLAYDQRLFYYNGNFKVTSIQYSDGLARQSSGEFRDQSGRIERLIDKTFQSSMLRKKYIRSRVIRLSPDMGGVMAQVVLTFLFSATDNAAAFLGKIDSVLQKKLNKYSGPVRIDLASSTISDMRRESAETLFSDFCGLRQNRSSKSKSSSTSERVVGGLASAELGDWPWQASLRQNNIHRCGATLISNTWLLSAAHCFRKANNPRLWTVTFGTLLRPSRMKRFVKAIIVHEKYRYPAHNYDIAIVKLSKGVDFTNTVHRVCLPDPSQIFPYNSDAVITGWGALSDDGPSPNVLREATVKLIDSNTCNRKEVYDGVITPGMLCAGYLEGGVDACQGDSGGPLVSPDSRGMWYLVGIVSWGDECAKPNKPGVYTRVTYYRDWITSKIGL